MNKIKLKLKNKKLHKNEKVARWIGYVEDEINKELTTEKIAAILMGMPYVSRVDKKGKLHVTILEDLFV